MTALRCSGARRSRPCRRWSPRCWAARAPVGADPGAVDPADRPAGRRPPAFPRVSPEGGGSTGAARTTVGQGPERVGGAHVADRVGQRGHGAVDGDRAPRPRVSETVETVSEPGAGEAHDVGAAYGVGDAQLEHLRLLAEPADPVGVEQLEPGLVAAGEPAERGAVGLLRGGRRPRRSRPSARRCAGCSRARPSRRCAPSCPRPRGSAKRVAWHTELMPLPLGVVGRADQRASARGEPAAAPAAGTAASRRSPAWCRPASTAPAAGSASTPPRTTKTPAEHRQREQHGVPAERVQQPPPPTVPVDRRRTPGSAAASAIGASISIGGADVLGLTARLAAERRRSPWPAAARPAPRSRRARGRCRRWSSAARWASRSTLRCWSGRWCSASSTAFCSGSMPFSRCHSRATWRRWAIAQARGRTHSSGRAAGRPCASGAGRRRRRR